MRRVLFWRHWLLFLMQSAHSLRLSTLSMSFPHVPTKAIKLQKAEALGALKAEVELSVWRKLFLLVPIFCSLWNLYFQLFWHQILPQCCIFNIPLEYLFLKQLLLCTDFFLAKWTFFIFHATFIFSTVQIRHMYEESTVLLNQMCEMLIKKHDEWLISSASDASLLFHIWIKMMLQHQNKASSGHVNGSFTQYQFYQCCSSFSCFLI